MASSFDISAYSDALVVLGAAGVIVPVVRRMGVSPVLGYLGAGALLGPLGLGSFISSAPFLKWVTVEGGQNVSSIADLGVVFLLFMIGLELSYERLMSMRRLVFGLGGLQVLLCSAAIAGTLSIIGYRPPLALLIGACFALSSTAVVLEVLAQKSRMKSLVGRTSFSILLAQDLAVIPILMYISILGAGSNASVLASVGSALGQAVLAVLTIVVVGRFFMRPVFRVVASAKSSELMMAAILFSIIGSGFVAGIAGLSMTLGAFVAGLLLAETAYSKVVEATVEPFKGLLLGVFFFSIGMKIDVRVILPQAALVLAAIAALVAIKFVVTFWLARLFRFSPAVSVETSLLLSPGGEFAFVGIGLAASLKLLDAQQTTLCVTVAALSMCLIPLFGAVSARLARAISPPSTPAAELTATPAAQQKHAIVIGYGRTGKVVCELLKRHKTPYIAVDSNAASVVADRQAGHEVYYGNAAQPEFLKTCGLTEAVGVIVTLDNRSVIDKVVQDVRIARPEIFIVSRARDEAHARHLYAIGVNDAVPETVEASLQLSEAALIGIGVPTGRAIVSVHTYRDDVRKALQKAAAEARAEANGGPLETPDAA